ncbi:hypothetical protein [Rhodosalinus sp. FB01]
MTDRIRFLRSAIRIARAESIAPPWQRGARRAAFIARRQPLRARA